MVDVAAANARPAPRSWDRSQSVLAGYPAMLKRINDERAKVGIPRSDATDLEDAVRAAAEVTGVSEDQIRQGIPGEAEPA